MKHRHFPRYNDDADFTTNAPSYYEDLARKEKLIRLLAERIWGYEKILDETLEEIQERFRAWDKNLEDFPEDVKALLQQWLDDGTLDHIINDTIFNWKLDTTIFEQFRDSVTTQLQQTKNQFKNKIYLSDNHQLDSFPRLPGETDDTERFQRAIDSFSGNIAGTIHISGDIHISKQVSCYKTGLRLMGDNNRKSRIISNFGGISLFIKPLFNGSPYTSISYCKFYADDIALVAEGDAIETGTGLWLQWLFASSYINLYTSGFKKHIVLRGSHLNTFYNLYQGNKDSSVQTLEIHNRGVGLSADATQDETGETTSNNNHIIGGWINNCSLDFRGMNGTVVEKIDIEPASDTIYTGMWTTFRDCRFERQDYYAVHNTLYPRFPWFEIGNHNKIERCMIHNEGPNNYGPLNPYFKIVGNYNEIEVPLDTSFNAGMITFEENAKGNVIKYNKNYTSVESKNEYESIRYNSKENKFIFTDFDNGNVVETQGDYSNGKGRFESYNSRNTSIVGDDFIKQGLTSEPIDIALPFGRTEPSHFTKLTSTTNTGNRRFIQTDSSIKAPETGVYTLSCLVYIPHTTITEVTCSPIIGIGTRVEKAKNKWITVRSRTFLNEGDTIQPTVSLNGQVGEIVYVGEISVCKGNNAIFIPNGGYSPIIKMV